MMKYHLLYTCIFNHGRMAMPRLSRNLRENMTTLDKEAQVLIPALPHLFSREPAVWRYLVLAHLEARQPRFNPSSSCTIFLALGVRCKKQLRTYQS